MSRPWRTAAIAAIVVVAVGGTAAAAVGFGGDEPDGTGQRSSLPPSTAQVTRATLVDYEEVEGELGYGETVPVRYGGAGLVTWLAAVGSTVDRGKPLFKVDERPVVLLYGGVPLYRPLSRGVEGADVKQFEENLRALGYDGFTVDDEFTSSTAAAVKEWQEKLGVAETGTVAPGQVVYTGGAIRVAEQAVRVGDPAGGEILRHTGTVRVVTIDLNVEDQRLAVAGAKVTVTLPDGKPVEGVVATVGSVATTASEENNPGGGDTTIEVVVTIADQAALGSLQQSPVEVRLVASERRDVLTVPVAALVALAEGGYGVQVVEGSSTRYVAVETGMFANGRVEVRGAELKVGTVVGMPK